MHVGAGKSAASDSARTIAPLRSFFSASARECHRAAVIVHPIVPHHANETCPQRRARVRGAAGSTAQTAVQLIRRGLPFDDELAYRLPLIRPVPFLGQSIRARRHGGKGRRRVTTFSCGRRGSRLPGSRSCRRVLWELVTAHGGGPRRPAGFTAQGSRRPARRGSARRLRPRCATSALLMLALRPSGRPLLPRAVSALPAARRLSRPRIRLRRRISGRRTCRRPTFRSGRQETPVGLRRRAER